MSTQASASLFSKEVVQKVSNRMINGLTITLLLITILTLAPIVIPSAYSIPDIYPPYPPGLDIQGKHIGKFQVFGVSNPTIFTEIKGIVTSESGIDINPDPNYSNLLLPGNFGIIDVPRSFSKPNSTGLHIETEDLGTGFTPAPWNNPAVPSVMDHGVPRPVRVGDHVRATGLYAIDSTHFCSEGHIHYRGLLVTCDAHAELHPYTSLELENPLTSGHENIESHTVVAPVYTQFYESGESGQTEYPARQRLAIGMNTVDGINGTLLENSMISSQHTDFFIQAPPRSENTQCDGPVKWYKDDEQYSNQNQIRVSENMKADTLHVSVDVSGTDITNPTIFHARYHVYRAGLPPPVTSFIFQGDHFVDGDFIYILPSTNFSININPSNISNLDIRYSIFRYDNSDIFWRNGQTIIHDSSVQPGEILSLPTSVINDKNYLNNWYFFGSHASGGPCNYNEDFHGRHVFVVNDTKTLNSIKENIRQNEMARGMLQEEGKKYLTPHPIMNPLDPYKRPISDSIRDKTEFWHDGVYKDELAGVMQDMINDGIIHTQTKVISSKTFIPSYVEKVAQYWARGNISDSDFTNSLEFLINSGIVK